MKHVNQQETPHYESSTLPYVCWYQNDFLGGVRGMRAHEIGIYTILLNEMYARGRPLELSVERLARLCGCDKRTFVNVLEMLIAEGKILNLANGLWNKRCENVFYERAKLLEQKSFAGRTSAQKRKKINIKLQQAFNKSAKDDTHNLEAQKEEEKETPDGVSEKKFFSSSEPQEERVRGGTSASLSPLLPQSVKPELTEQPSSAQKQAESCTTAPKGQRLPADWTADIRAAIAEGLSQEQAHWQEKKFRDYWRAKSGKDALKVDWQATWRNWFRREIERLKENQEKLATFSSHSPSSAPSSNSSSSNNNNNNDALYRSLINYRVS
ncbi:YdaU family protein [Bartonella sp. CB60]|uniref:YdaU family protein n=1 Tax=Bartonella sp. CB60 TaxID=3113619 RepID=UPI00300E64C3